MKKTYIAPNFLLVNISCKKLVATSLNMFSEGADADVVLVKEDNSPVTNKSVWDEEW